MVVVKSQKGCEWAQAKGLRAVLTRQRARRNKGTTSFNKARAMQIVEVGEWDCAQQCAR